MHEGACQAHAAGLHVGAHLQACRCGAVMGAGRGPHAMLWPSCPALGTQCRAACWPSGGGQRACWGLGRVLVGRTPLRALSAAGISTRTMASRRATAGRAGLQQHVARSSSSTKHGSSRRALGGPAYSLFRNKLRRYLIRRNLESRSDITWPNRIRRNLTCLSQIPMLRHRRRCLSARVQ